MEKESPLDAVQALFCRHIERYGGRRKKELRNEVEAGMHSIWQALMTTLCGHTTETELVTITGQIYYNDLTTTDVIARLEKQLKVSKKCTLIRQFLLALGNTLSGMKQVFSRLFLPENRTQLLLLLDRRDVALPFVIKALTQCKDCTFLAYFDMAETLNGICLRDQVIRPQADLAEYINPRFKTMDNAIGVQNLSNEIDIIAPPATGIRGLMRRLLEKFQHKTDKRIENMWTDEAFRKALSAGTLEARTAKILLIAYENHLLRQADKDADEILYSQADQYHIEPISDQLLWANSLGNYVLMPCAHDIRKDMQWQDRDIRNRQQEITNYLLNNF